MRNFYLLGTLGVSGEADLFFLNPNGIVFGPESSLDMGGSFVASTGESFIFGEEAVFSATSLQSPSLLTISVPTGIQFGQQPGAILYQAEFASLSEGLIAQPGRTIALLGGELDFTGAELETIGGRIELGGIGTAGIVDILSSDQGWTFKFDDIQEFADLTATLSFINTGDRTAISSEAAAVPPSETSGDIVVQAADITLNRSTLVRTATRTERAAGDITINARTLDMSGGSQLSSDAATITPENIQGNAGRILVNASESVRLQGGIDVGFAVFTTGIRSDSNGERIDPDTGIREGIVFGDGGDITINTRQLFVLDGADLSASSSSVGDSGRILINASESVDVIGFLVGQNDFTRSIISTSTRGGSGNGGDLIIETDRLSLRDSGSLLSLSKGEGAGGSIVVNADTVEALGAAPILNDIEESENEAYSGLSTVAEGAGNAGQISVTARTIRLQLGGRLTSETTPGSTGNGNLLSVIATEDIQIEGVSEIEKSPSGFFTSTRGAGNAGQLRVQANEVTVESGGVISAATLNETARSAGSINLQTNQLTLDQGRLTVETSAQGGEGAEIFISGIDLLLLRNGSLLSAEAFEEADGGNIRLDAEDGFLVAPPQEDSDIIARAELGDGGSIDVLAQNIFGLSEGLAVANNGTNDIDASSQFGLSGTVTLTQLDVDPVQEAARLPENTSVPDISQRCNPGEGISNFVATGRGGIPLGPEEAIAPQDLWEELYLSEMTESTHSSAATTSTELPQTAQSNTSEITPIIEAQGWRKESDGSIQLVANSASSNNLLAVLNSQASCSLLRN